LGTFQNSSYSCEELKCSVFTKYRPLIYQYPSEKNSEFFNVQEKKGQRQASDKVKLRL
jgi:hypothetical protein